MGWIFGRTGCFTAHDHPGRHTTFFLSVWYLKQTPADFAGPRHRRRPPTSCSSRSPLTAILFVYARKPRPPGRLIGLACLMYAPIRFGLDFLRATDVARPDMRYAGLTPAQWACLATLVLGIRLMTHRPESEPPAATGTTAAV